MIYNMLEYLKSSGSDQRLLSILKVRLLRFKADLVKQLRHCYWDLDILYTKWKLTIFSISACIQNIEHTLSFRKVNFNQLFSLLFFGQGFLAIVYWILNFFRDVKTVPLEGTMSQIFYLGLKPIFHCNAKYLALGVGVGQCPRRQNFALEIPTCWYLLRWVTQFFCVLADAKPESCLLANAKLKRKPVEYRLRWVPMQNSGVGHVHLIFLVLISFALGSQREPAFQWNMGLSFYFIWKNGKVLMYFLNFFFLDFIKQKLGHLKKIWDTVPSIQTLTPCL